MSSELAATVRRLKPHKYTGSLTRRPDHELPFVPIDISAGAELLLDTTVYIDELQGRLPANVQQLMAARRSNHSSIAVGELAFAIGRLDPTDPRTAAAVEQIKGAIDDIPSHRLTTPNHRSILRASIAAGIISRIQGYPEANRKRIFNDAILFFQAIEGGQCLLTRNIVDIDYLQQIEPAGRLLFYRQR